MDMGERVRFIRIEKGWSQQEAANVLGITVDRIRNLETGRVKNLTTAELVSFQLLGVAPKWLLSGETPIWVQNEDDTAHVPYYEHVTPSAVSGIEVFNEEAEGVYDIPACLLGGKNQNIVSLKVSGYSMSPRIDDGDRIFVDISERTLRAEGVYVLRVNDSLLVKIVQWKPDGVKLISQNKDFDSIDLTGTEDVQIIGRVIGLFAKL
ncbi:MAG: helix-turn-helix domain-containing protein [Deferribacteraceae bacterium]|jgi:phage repressor protein C with HTH and peptisase S24 domain|nr:helix-turn-helix domain-containing protein [Deferribacteraceae bacterium]